MKFTNGTLNTLTQALLIATEEQIKSDQDSGSAFSKLKEKLSSFFKRQSQTEKKSDASK